MNSDSVFPDPGLVFACRITVVLHPHSTPIWGANLTSRGLVTHLIIAIGVGHPTQHHGDAFRLALRRGLSENPFDLLVHDSRVEADRRRSSLSMSTRDPRPTTNSFLPLFSAAKDYLMRSSAAYDVQRVPFQASHRIPAGASGYTARAILSTPSLTNCFARKLDCLAVLPL
jgi:hypothetical protein